MDLLEFIGEIFAALFETSRSGDDNKKGNDGCFWYGLGICIVLVAVFVWLNIN